MELHIYTASIALQPQAAMGIGWVITDREGRVQQEGSQPIRGHACEANVGEITAATEALQNAKAASSVTIFTRSRWFAQQIAIDTPLAAYSSPALQATFKGLRTARVGHQDVKAQTPKNDIENIWADQAVRLARGALELAQAQASPQKRQPRRARRQYAR